VESVSSNIFILEKDKFITPALDDCGVEGVMRNFLLRDIFPTLGFTCSEEDISLQRLLGSDAGFLCNSILGVRSIHSCKKLSGEQVLFTGSKQLVAVQEAVLRSYQNI
jgi:branched-subunit amino acid aminotransferase/4-amino-4-deoxychorismate lyase